MAAVNITANVPIVFSMSSRPWGSVSYDFPQGNVVIETSAIGGTIVLNGSPFGVDIPLNDLITLADFLVNRFSPGNGLGPWTVVLDSPNWDLVYGMTTVGTASKDIWAAVGLALYAYIG